MPRPVWSGAITFGLVTIPVKVVPATENHSISFHQYHRTDMARVRVKKVCETDGRTLSVDEIGRGFQTPDGDTIEITEDELDAIPLPTAKAIEISGFVPAASIDPIRIGEGYYLEGAGQVAAKPYVLLRKALERNAKVAVAKFAWHGRERLGLLRVKDDVLVLHAMKWPDEVRSPGALVPGDVEVGEREIEAAVTLVDSMPATEPSAFKDEYREALEQVIAAKSSGTAPPEAVPDEEPGGEVLDLMSALRQSLERTHGEEAPAGREATVHELPRRSARRGSAKGATGDGAARGTSKKAVGKKAPAKRAAAKKAPAKKAAAEKAPAKKSGAAKGAAKKARSPASTAKKPAKRSASASTTKRNTRTDKSA
ncbi:Ku protein [Streptomyces sp. SID4919]|uniref:non-homologous end joining protein Ku n=1 Tax=unclassified Streptomyces TaxID=2593676 RepID=UPI000823CD8C|nr:MULTISPECIES: Ku protein [unclassified Streptomyces]MYY09266.1 Ku protein [Streptomyces sp. SID4919]SCK42278.1 DNA end-binding protein Ku [Streptomyces sp. AmelKG-E11A]